MGKQNIYRRVLIEQFQLVVEFTNIYYVRIKGVSFKGNCDAASMGEH